ncbi:MAG: HEAT repeat domain-containing protein [Bacteroidota bacterium]
MKHIGILIFVGIFAACETIPAQTVTTHPRPTDPFAQRWQWGLKEGLAARNSKGYYIVYSIQKLMAENSYMSTGSFMTGTITTSFTLYDLINGGRSVDSNLTDAAEKALRRIRNKGRAEFKVMKDLAIIIEYPSGKSNPEDITDVSICNMELEFDFEGKTILWLGPAGDPESFAILKNSFPHVRSREPQENLVSAIGAHKPTQESFTFLSGVLEGRYPTDTREQAAFWLGWHATPAALKLLASTAQNDNSEDVREQAVFGISQMETPEALDALIDLARNAKDSEVRQKAVFWLGQSASRKAVGEVEDIVMNDADVEVQKQALYALANAEDEKGVEFLIKIARMHPKPALRKHAIHSLGQSEDPKAIEAIIAIAKGR